MRVGLIVPLTQGTGPSVVGQSLRNAAELALSEAGSQDITLLVKDDLSTPDGAKAAASAVLADGAELIIGPLYSPNVREVGNLARAAGKPVIAFSTDTSVAARGVYLLSFLVENYVDRIVDYAAASGKKSFAALIPDNDYGRVAEAELQQAAARRGVRVEIIEHYASAAQAGPAAQTIAAAASQIDALFIPEQADAMPAIAQVLTANKLDSQPRADPRDRPVERRARAQPAGPAGRLVRGARLQRLHRLRRTLSRQIRQRSDAHRDARL